jgi:hypothetical protein
MTARGIARRPNCPVLEGPYLEPLALLPASVDVTDGAQEAFNLADLKDDLLGGFGVGHRGLQSAEDLIVRVAAEFVVKVLNQRQVDARGGSGSHDHRVATAAAAAAASC